MNATRPSRGYLGTEGFAIPVAIFVMVVLSLLALSGLYISRSNAEGNLGIPLLGDLIRRSAIALLSEHVFVARCRF